MHIKNIRLLNKIANKIYQFTRENGIFECEDKDTSLYKLSRIFALSQQLRCSTNNAIGELDVAKYFTAIAVNLQQVYEVLSLGEADFESEDKTLQILSETRGLVYGLGLYLELVSLEPGDDIPEHIYESFEPFVDIESGECHYPQNIELKTAILNLLDITGNSNPLLNDTSQVAGSIDSVVEKLTKLKLEVDADLVVDFGDGMTGYARATTGIGADLADMQLAFRHYFEPTHQRRSGKIAAAAEEIYNAKNTGVTNLTDVSSGELIIAAAEALRSAYLLNERLSAYEERISWQGLKLSARRMPTSKNRGNLLIRNLGRYGRKSEGNKGKRDILDDFADVTYYAGEDKLIQVMCSYGSKPYAITGKMLDLPETMAGQKILAKFQQSLFLIFCAEIFRYFPIEGLDVCAQAKKIPFALALGLGLELLEDGHITLEDMFDKDAQYGLPTGSKILDSSAAISQKTEALLRKYQLCMQENVESARTFLNAYPGGYVAQSQCNHIGILNGTYGHSLRK
tara:strand:- start:11822 stop:13357 length:1536 start_codon:yes stop_codon:yes gene_type:complete